MRPRGWLPCPRPTTLRLRVFAGPQPADVLRRFTARTGRQPAPDAPWVLGPWIQLGGSVDARLAQMAKLRAADAPVSVVQTYTHYLPCGDHVARRAEERAFVGRDARHRRRRHDVLQPDDLRVVRAALHARPSRAGALSRRADGSPYVYNYTGTRRLPRRPVRLHDAAPAGGHYATLLARGGRGRPRRLDGGLRRVHAARRLLVPTGVTGSAHHNRYVRRLPLRRLRGSSAAAQRPVVRFQRSGWTGAAPCAQVVWNGDPSTDWGFDGLTSAVWGGLGMGLSGIAIWGTDIGGFFALVERALTTEMLIRWVQFGAVSGVMRTQRNGFAAPRQGAPAGLRRRPDRQLEALREAADAALSVPRGGGRRRTGGAACRSCATSRSCTRTIRRPLLATTSSSSAPTCSPRRCSRRARSRARSTYRRASGSISGARARTTPRRARSSWDRRTSSAAGGVVTLPAPLDELPLLVRAGAVLPLLPADVDTLRRLRRPGARAGRARRSGGPGGAARVPAGARGGWDVLGAGAAPVRRGRWRVGARGAGARRRRSHLQASLATLEVPFVPCRVEWAGQAIDTWTYDEATAVLRAEFEGRTGRLRVTGCGG